MNQLYKKVMLYKEKMMAQSVRFALAGLAVLVVAVSGLGMHFYLRARSLEKNPAQQAVSDTAALIAQVGRLMVLPDEQPEIATVTNADALKNDPFFTGAKVGDKLLIFSKARRAILFDPVAGVILNAAPLNTAPATK